MRRRSSGIRQCIAGPLFFFHSCKRIDFIRFSASPFNSRYLFSSRNVLTPTVTAIGEKLHEVTAKPRYFC